MDALKFRLKLGAVMVGMYMVYSAAFDATVVPAMNEHAERSKAFASGDFDALPAPDGSRFSDRLGAGRHDEFAAERARFEARMEELRRQSERDRFYDGFSDDSYEEGADDW